MHAVKGIYVLIIQLSRYTDVTVGKLGTIRFQKGLYAYVGSAQVALEKRLERHLRKDKLVFWHVDYLLQSPNAKIMKIFTRVAEKAEECTIANRIAEKGKAILYFGCSDCHCTSHLFRIKDYGFLRESMQEHTFTSSSS